MNWWYANVAARWRRFKRAYVCARRGHDFSAWGDGLMLCERCGLLLLVHDTDEVAR